MIKIVVDMMGGDNGATPTSGWNDQYSYEFSGWNVEPVAVTWDATYTAEYNEIVNDYTITFDSLGWSSVGSQSVAYGSTWTKPADPTLVWYTFKGWHLTGVDSEFAFTTTPIVWDITLYANWSGWNVKYTLIQYQQAQH